MFPAFQLVVLTHIFACAMRLDLMARRPRPALPMLKRLPHGLALCATLACSDSATTPGAVTAGSAGAAGSSSSGDAGTGGKAPGDAGSLPNPPGEPDFEVPAGLISVRAWLSLGETELSAVFASAPPLRFHRESERIGQCRLMEPYAPSSCTPVCSSSEACIEASCRAYPTRINRGPIDWTWPDGHQTVSASDIDGYHAIGEAHQPGEVVVRVDGLTLRAPSDPALEPEADWAASLAARGAGADVSLRWTNPSPGARIRLHMTDCTGSHGGLAAAEIECDGADSGVLVLPGAFLDRLDAGDWSHGECGSHRLERYYVGSADGDDSVRLETIARSDFFYRPR